VNAEILRTIIFIISICQESALIYKTLYISETIIAIPGKVKKCCPAIRVNNKWEPEVGCPGVLSNGHNSSNLSNERKK